MPQFKMFSVVDRELIKMMLIKATEYEDHDIEFYTVKYFNRQ